MHLEENQAWIVENLPHGKTPIHWKFVYRVKYKFNGTIERFKTHLMVIGDHQLQGFDINETFTSVAKISSVRTFLLVAIPRGWELHQTDVNNVFLHGD